MFPITIVEKLCDTMSIFSNGDRGNPNGQRV